MTNPYQLICKHRWHKPYINEDVQKCSLCDKVKEDFASDEEIQVEAMMNALREIARSAKTFEQFQHIANKLLNWQIVFKNVDDFHRAMSQVSVDLL